MEKVESDTLDTPEKIDAEIERLKTERKAMLEQLKDPVQTNRRHVRRAQIVGRTLLSEKWRTPLNPELLSSVRECAGDEGRWLFEEQILKLDGWLEKGEKGRPAEWLPPALTQDDLDDHRKK